MAETPITRRFNVRIPLRDGITLAADLFRPGPDPAPVVIMRTPYGRSGERQSSRATTYARAGYAYLSVDVRGRGDSDGSFVPYRNDGPDGADVIDWAAAQDWCNGDVATYGGSYAGRIQWLTALHRPPPSGHGVPGHAQRPVRGVADRGARPHARALVPDDRRPGLQYTERHRLDDGVPAPAADRRWTRRPAFARRTGARKCRHNTLDEWWEPVRYQHRIGEIDVPVLHISGWYDDEEIGTPANFAAMTAAGRAGQRLLMGPWGHQVNTTRTRRNRLRPGRAHRPGRVRAGLPGRARAGSARRTRRRRRSGSS